LKYFLQLDIAWLERTIQLRGFGAGGDGNTTTRFGLYWKAWSRCNFAFYVAVITLRCISALAILGLWQLVNDRNVQRIGVLGWFLVVFACRIALLTHLTAETRAPNVVQVKDVASGALTARFAKRTMCSHYADNTAHALSAVLSHC
jgi:hypothetical protein